MHMITLTRRALLGLVSVSALWMGACGSDVPSGPSQTTAAPPAVSEQEATGTVARSSEPAPTQAAAKFELKFMTDMIDHHMMAVMMAEVCVQKAIHPELRSMCEQIMATQMSEIETMQSWLQSWYGVSHSPHMTQGMHNQHHKLASMSGAEFEIAFLEMMIRHHRPAVREARHCIDRAYHQELISLCQNIAQSQLAEIEQMEQWLCSWYGRC